MSTRHAISLILLVSLLTSLYFLIALSEGIQHLLGVLFKCIAIVIFAILLLKGIFLFIKSRQHRSLDCTSLAFFHPYCNSGGGGERVLWLIISSLLSDEEISKNLLILVYTGDEEEDEVGKDDKGKTKDQSASKYTTF